MKSSTLAALVGIPVIGGMMTLIGTDLYRRAQAEQALYDRYDQAYSAAKPVDAFIERGTPVAIAFRDHGCAKFGTPEFKALLDKAAELEPKKIIVPRDIPRGYDPSMPNRIYDTVTIQPGTYEQFPSLCK